jgi:hypothetical protein
MRAVCGFREIAHKTTNFPTFLKVVTSHHTSPKKTYLTSSMIDIIFISKIYSTMIIFFINYLTCSIEVFKQSQTLRQLIIPCIFFSLLNVAYYLSFLTDSIETREKELAIILGLVAFIFKYILGGLRLIAQVWSRDKDKTFYFFALAETIVLWLLLNPLYR